MTMSNDPYTDAGFDCIGQIRKGAAKQRGKIGPDLGEHFRAVFQRGEEESAALFEQVFGKQPTEIEVTFPFDEPDRVWWSGMEAYTGKGIRVMLVEPDTSEILYWFDPHEMKVIVRNGLDMQTGEPAVWDGESPAYTYRSTKDNSIKHVFPKLNCRLRVMVPALRRVVYMEVRTGSWNDRRNITRQLNGLYQLRGSLKGIPLVLRRRWQEITTSRPDGKRYREEKSLISIEPTEEWATRLFQEIQQEATPGFTMPVAKPDDNPQGQSGDEAQEPNGDSDWQDDPMLWLDSVNIADWSFHDAACEQLGYISREHVIQALNEEMDPGWAKFGLRDLWATLEENAPDGGDIEIPGFVDGLNLDDGSFLEKAQEVFEFDGTQAVVDFLVDEIGEDWATRTTVKEAWIFIQAAYNESVNGDGELDDNPPEQEEFDIPF